MKNSTFKVPRAAKGPEAGFGMFRLSRAKVAADLAPNTLRKYNKEGLRFYRMGKAIFISFSELEQFIVAKAD